jgi:hypothetical protein
VRTSRTESVPPASQTEAPYVDPDRLLASGNLERCVEIMEVFGKNASVAPVLALLPAAEFLSCFQFDEKTIGRAANGQRGSPGNWGLCSRVVKNNEYARKFEAKNKDTAVYLLSCEKRFRKGRYGFYVGSIRRDILTRCASHWEEKGDLLQEGLRMKRVVRVDREKLLRKLEEAKGAPLTPKEELDWPDASRFVVEQVVMVLLRLNTSASWSRAAVIFGVYTAAESWRLDYGSNV